MGNGGELCNTCTYDVYVFPKTCKYDDSVIRRLARDKEESSHPPSEKYHHVSINEAQRTQEPESSH